MKKKNASITVYVVALMVIFLAFSAFAIDGTITFTNRMKLQNITEMAALSAAAEFNYSQGASDSEKETQVTATAEDVFNILKKDGLSPAEVSVTVNISSQKVLLKTSYISQPFFLAFLGVNGINLKAQACAQSEELPVKANYPGVNWLTPKASYFSDILSKNVNMHDTAILIPLGNFESASYDAGLVNFQLVESGNDKPLSLGPGGFITIKLPAPIIDKTGNDLYIKESKDALEGYMVFAGIDNNPANPYVQNDNQGDKISWVNISCSGTPEKTDSNGLLGAYTIKTDSLNTQDRFFGSAYFDISDSCIGKTISMVKYIRIVDDNDESAFVTSGDGKYYKAKLYGEASSATPGADIDEVKVLNHVKLIKVSDFSS